MSIMSNLSTRPAPKPRKRANTAPALPGVPSDSLARAMATLEKMVKPSNAAPVATIPAVEAKKSEPAAPLSPFAEAIMSRYDRPDGMVPVVVYTPRDAAFDLTRDNGSVYAVNVARGTSKRFLLASETWGHEVKRVVSVAIESTDFETGAVSFKWAKFAFADANGLRPWSIHAKCPIPYAERVQYVEFLESMHTLASDGKVELTIVKS